MNNADSHRASAGPTDLVDPRGLGAQPDWPPAVIAGAYQTGVLGVRGLRRRGVRAFCFDCDANNPGFRSVYGPARLCPNPERDGPQWLRFMIDLATEIGGRPVLIASSDLFVSAIAQHAEALSVHYVVSPGSRTQGLLAEKQTQYELAAQHGMPMPRTQFVRSEDEVRAFAAEAAFPCLIKPTHFREWRRLPPDNPLYQQKIVVAETAEDLVRFYRQACAVSGHVVLQEIIQGPDTNKRVYLSCYDRDGRRIGHAMFRELRCDPVGFGPATVSHPIDDPPTDAVCDRFLQRLGYVGICEIEMKWDDRDGQVKIIEANPRLSGGGDAAPYAGVELVWLNYLDMIGHRVQPVRPTSRDFRHIVLRSDARIALAYRRRGMISWRDVFRAYRPPLAFFDLDSRDWRYSAETLMVATRALVRSVLPGRTS